MNFRRIQIGCLVVLFSFAFSCGGRKTPTRPPGARPTPPVQQPDPPGKPSDSSTSKPDRPDRTDDLGKPDQPPQSGASAGDSSEGPILRIGLYTAAKELRVSSSGDYYVLDKSSETSRRQVRGEIRIQIEPETPETRLFYQIQVFSLSRPENARELKESLAEKLGLPTSIRVNPDNGISQVRVGEFATREEAQDYLPNLQPDYPDAFIVLRESATGKGNADRTGLTLVGADGLRLTSRAGFQVFPVNAASFLRVGGKTYRGSFDIFLNKSDRITLVNQLAMEDYLLGVVPAEMSPSHFPEFAALAAQAVAARTYALKNMGRYRSEGFDLTDDTRTQVYGGVGMEKPMTSEIVRQTSGIAVYYDGKPIDAMFMSTCGGRTEDFGLVYDAKPVPYLKSVICAVEHSADATGVRLVGARAVAGTFRAADGSLANRNLELARALRLLSREDGAPLTPSELAEPIRKDEARRWIQAAVETVKPSRRVALKDSGIESRGGFLQQAVAAFFGEEEIQRRISPADADYYMAGLTDGAELPSPLQSALGYLMQRKLWRPTAENTVAASAPMRRGDAVALLIDWIEAEKPEILRRGDFVETAERDRDGRQPAAVKIKSGGKTRDFRLTKNLNLFRVDRDAGAGSGQATPIPGLKLVGTEKLAFHLNDQDEIDFMEIELSPSGAASDRFSAAATWKVTLARNVVIEKLRGLTGDLGALLDLQPALLGQSGRVVRIQAIGAGKSVVLNGYRVRGALGLQDTLFTLTREFNADGAVAAFTFSGRGSGHGIGLCQTGAFGMAKAGKSYEEILKTYYTGVDIRKVY